MARFSSAYKQNAPTRRIVQGENTCEKGMYWSDKAAEPGYVHTILNYDVDPVSYTIRVSGGLHVTDIAAGCSFLDRKEFGNQNSDLILVRQPRNEYCLKADEGITNIISAQKLTIKNNQNLEEELRQHGYTADDAVCYKLLTYNPVNQRLMSVTLLQASRDKYFTVGDNYQLRRLNANPISCGIGDDYLPRAKRNKFTDTFGQKLHSTLYMQTVPHCEGYGNKTFCFTKKADGKTCLSFTDVLQDEEDFVGSNDNSPKAAQHVLDYISDFRTIINLKDNILYTASESTTLRQSVKQTIGAGFSDINNGSKLNDFSYSHIEVKPKVLTPGEATLWGYNMLSDSPYTFECRDTSNTQTASLSGVLLMKPDGSTVLLKPILNTPGKLFIYYNSDRAYLAGTNFLQLKVEVKNPYDEWRTLKVYTTSETHSALASGKPIQLDYTGSDETTLVRTTLTDTGTYVEEPDGTKVYLVVSQILTTLSYAKDASKTSPSPEIYDLGSATGMCFWKGRLVLWGVLNAENMLFMSEPNEPEYFAYPNGADILEENVIHALPYGDALIVFTNTKLWRIDMNTDGLSWNKYLLQQNLRISDLDIPYITVLKNMLFFKSDKQFYMLVPTRGSVSGETTIAPISRVIQDFLSDPFKAIRELLVQPYPELTGVQYTNPRGILNADGTGLMDIFEKPITDYLVKYGVHTEHNRVIIDWWFDMSDWKLKKGAYSDQDTQTDIGDKEYWLVQLIYDTQTYSWTLRTHTTNHIGVFIADAVNQNTDFVNLVLSTGDGAVVPTWGVSISHRKTPEDIIIKEFSLGTNAALTLEPSYPRFQVFDTGYKELSSPSLKKRIREVQLSFEPHPNSAQLQAAFTVDLDGQPILSPISQEVFEEDKIDNVNGHYKEIKIIDKINYQDLSQAIDARLYTGTSENPTQPGTFVLNQSSFEGVKQLKVRKQINGKGYLARMKFMNITTADYTIVNYAFVYHNKNAR